MRLAELGACLAYLRDGFLLAPNDAAVREAMAGEGGEGNLKDWEEYHAMAPGGGEPPLSPDDHRWRIARRRTLRQQLDQALPTIPPNVGIQVEVRFGPAKERLWLWLHRASLWPASNRRYIAQLTADSRIRPDLRAGDWLFVSESDILDFRESVASPPRTVP